LKIKIMGVAMPLLHFYRETEQLDAAKRPVYGSPFSLHIPINAQKGKGMKVLGAEDSLRLGEWDG
jgi:hypothetical protein